MQHRPAVNVAMVLLNNTGVGGAERRFAQVYRELRRSNTSISLAINESLFARLQRDGLFDSEDQPGLIVKERAGRLARLLIGSTLEDERHAESAVTRSHRVRAFLAFGLLKFDYLLACVTVTRWLRRGHASVMHVILGGAYVVLPLQVVGGAPPAVVSVVSPSLRQMVGSTLGLLLFRLALRFARVVDALTDSVRMTLEREGICRERISVSPSSCVDTARFQPSEDKRPWIVFVGRLVTEKNPCLFVESCARVHERVPGARFYVLGDGPLMPSVRALVRQHHLDSSLSLGWNGQVETVLRHALVFVSLQRMDNYPSQALLEAMACGTAVVATRVGLTTKLVDDRVGLLVDPEPESVSDAVLHLLQHPDDAKAMGLRARQRVVQEHSLAAYLDYLLRVYERARQQGGAVA